MAYLSCNLLFTYHVTYFLLIVHLSGNLANYPGCHGQHHVRAVLHEVQEHFRERRGQSQERVRRPLREHPAGLQEPGGLDFSLVIMYSFAGHGIQIIE